MERNKIKSAAVYCGASTPENRKFTDAAYALGEYLAQNGIALVYGGSRCGTMEILADAAIANNGKVTGVFSDDVTLETPHPGITRTIMTKNLAERKKFMLDESEVVIALPGSFGTLDELFDASALIKLGRRKHLCGLLNIDGFYDPLITMLERMIKSGFTDKKYADLIVHAETPEEIFAIFNRLRS